jgi:lysophospholipase L1-like esterase
VSTVRIPVLVVPLLLLVACGGSPPTGPDPGGPTPDPGSPVSGFVYYDENGNGVLDAAETVRLPAVTVAIGGRTGQSVTAGRFTVSGVPKGSQTAAVRPDSLPPYFEPGSAVTVSVPQAGGDIAVPATLAIGSREKPNVYLAFGDSITWGEGSSDGSGYREYLKEHLRSYWGAAEVSNDGIPGTKSIVGQGRIGSSLVTHRPAYVLILYGTNDWNEPECRNDFPCYTVDALLSMVQDARSAGVFPILGTIPPVNPNYVDKEAADRNDWVTRMNDLVRAMARQQQVPIAEIHGAFLKQSSLPSLFSDFLHPNDEGFRLIEQAFFDAITKPASASSSSRGSFFFGFGRS